MFETRQSYKIRKINFIFNILNFGIVITSVILSNVMFILFVLGNITREWFIFYLLLSFFVSIISLISKIWIYAFVKIYFRRKYGFYLTKIINETKIDQSKKVLFLYTTYNEFLVDRFEQNINQDYKNIEVWVSDGSNQTAIREQIRAYCTTNNINLFQLPEKGSKNKADNINSFLKQYKGSFDFLWICDADVVFMDDYVSKSLKLFNWERAKRIAFISGPCFCYRKGTLYSKLGRDFEDSVAFATNYDAGISSILYPKLLGTSSIINNEFLKENNNLIPYSALEDFYLEAKAITNGWSGINNVLSCPKQLFDENIKAYLARNIRIYGWTIYYAKNLFFKNQNEKYNSWLADLIIKLMIPFIVFFGCLFLGLLFYVYIEHYNVIFKNVYYLSMTIFGLVIGLITLFLTSLEGQKFTKSVLIFQPFYVFIFGLSFLNKILKTWFKVIFLNQLPTFNNAYKRSTNIKNGFWLKFREEMIEIGIAALFILGINLIIHFIPNFEHKIILSYILNVLPVSCLLSPICLMLLYSFSLIKFGIDQDQQKRIDFNNDFINHRRTQEEYKKIISHADNPLF